ncbi:MAG TPA: SRPBCC domain-containing protein [Candidatus Paceibacterota bacterium]
MEKINFSIKINAPREKVWKTMLEDATYREWTKAFNVGSYYKGDWSKGSKMLFLGPDPETGKEGGMVSRIAENRLHEFISIQHLGMIKDGVEDTTSDEVKKWTPAFENYTFKDADGGTELLVEMDTNAEYKEMFSAMWPKALEILKKLAEK